MFENLVHQLQNPRIHLVYVNLKYLESPFQISCLSVSTCDKL